MTVKDTNLRGNPFTALTADERDEIRRVLSWVLAATQTTPEGRATIDKAIDLLSEEGAIGPEEVGQS